MYVTTYLRNQVLDRGLEKPLNTGRVYRIVPEGHKYTAPPKLGDASSADLVNELEHPNGWRRDTGQRLLVERRELDSAQLLRKLASTSSNSLAQLHALWTLDGMAMLNQPTLASALKAKDGKVRAAAIRLSERYLKAEGRTDLLKAVLAMVDDIDFDVRLQLLFSLGEVQKPEAQAALLKLAAQDLENPLLQSATITGLSGRELTALDHFTADAQFKNRTAGRDLVIQALARCIMASGNAESINGLLDRTLVAAVGWHQAALINGMVAVIPAKGKNGPTQEIKPIVLPSEPKSLAGLEKLETPELKKKLALLDQLLVWKGKPGYAAAEVKPLTEKEKQQFEAGKTLYVSICGACHQPHGLGLEGLAPPLAESEWVTGSEQRLIRIVLHGLRGPLNVKGKRWELEMPPLNILDDSQVSALLTYIRREWGHTASPVSEETVAKIRASTAQRQEAWTEADLLKVPAKN
jgi:mono/diheme cytochrome c family protein